MPHRLAAMFQLPTLSAIFGIVAGAGVIIDEKSLVPVGTIGAVSCIVWWVGRKLQHIDDRLDAVTRQSDRMERAARKIEDLPCFNSGACPVIQERESGKQHVHKPLKML